VIPNGVKEWWSIGVFSTPTLHYSITPGRQISTGVWMSEAWSTEPFSVLKRKTWTGDYELISQEITD
jgi:hypothetical protein